ncbi:DUF501 domain-containing protein [Halonatronum saccharophilum]|uniref:DUF501 domain-containing protein n=1 Tax=Halonatronum saccharophilum TaxID=150060 RepID=UPI000482409A|nr:DUF501 domain-containing protein [Halonatronum saccharophilum]
MNYNEEDLKVLEAQLGRRPRNLVKVAKRCKGGRPQVIVSSPILEKKDSVGVFPTTLWLSCKELNYRIGKLEGKGLVQEIQEKIKEDKDLNHRLEEAHRDYAKYRLELVEDERLKQLKEKNPGQHRVLSQSGVGGIMEFDGIKCLHTHYAHYLVNPNNPVGKIVDKLLKEEYGEINPKDCCLSLEGEEI